MSHNTTMNKLLSSRVKEIIASTPQATIVVIGVVTLDDVGGANITVDVAFSPIATKAIGDDSRERIGGGLLSLIQKEITDSEVAS